MTVGEILSTYELLNSFIKKDLSMPGKLSWIISDNLDELKRYVDRFNQKREYIGQQFIKDCKTIKNSDNTDSIAPEYMTEFVQNIQELMAIERQLSLEFVPVVEFKKLDNLSVLDIKALEFMISKEDD